MPAPTFPAVAAAASATGSSSSGFAGTGISSYADLGITSAQSGLHVTVEAQSAAQAQAIGLPAGARGPEVAGQNTTETVANLLSSFNTLIVSDPAQASQVAQQLYNAGLMSDSVYNSGQVSNSDIYNAYKKAVLGAAATGRPLGDYIVGASNAFQAAGGPKVKLPNVRYTATLTSQADVLAAGDAVFQRLLGRRMTPTELATIHSVLNASELSARTSEAQSAYEQMLGYRGLSPTGQAPGLGGAAPGGAPNTATNAQGGTSTVTQGPIVVPYQQPASAEASAYNYVMQNDRPEVQGQAVATAMQAISQFIGQK